MPIDTYEFETQKTTLETYEWDDIWWDHAPDKKNPRILIIGDSISRGYRRAAAKIACGTPFIDGIATSKAVDNPSFFALLDYYAQSGHSYDALFFNNGLHGWHLSEEEYEKGLEKLAAYAKERFNSKKFYIVLTTPVRRSKQIEVFDERNERAKMRNAAAVRVANSLDVEVVDLYSLLEDRVELYIEDGVHLSDEGYALLAREVLKK